MISDSNFHLPTVDSTVDLQKPENKKLLDAAINVEFNICDHGIQKTLDLAFKKADELGLTYVNFMVLDSSFIKDVYQNQLKITLKEEHYLTVLIDPNDNDAEKYIEYAANNNISGIKFHPYLQKLCPETFSNINKLCSVAEKYNIWVAIDCSYGTDMLYELNGVQLCASILRYGFKGKIIALHFGGPKVLDVMSLMAQHNNLYADLSLSLSYWKGSSVWQDLAFSMKNLGHQRFLFGSDQPFIQFNKAVNDFCDFALTYDLSDEQISDVKHNNFNKFLGI